MALLPLRYIGRSRRQLPDFHPISLWAAAAHTCSAFPPDSTGELSLLPLQPSLHSLCTTPRYLLFTLGKCSSNPHFSFLYLFFLFSLSQIIPLDYQHAIFFFGLKPNQTKPLASISHAHYHSHFERVAYSFQFLCPLSFQHFNYKML